MTGTAIAVALHLLLGIGEPPAPAQAQDAVRVAIEKQAADFAAAFNRGDAKAVAAMYTEDAIALPPDADLVRGRAAIEKLWTEAMASGMKTLAFTVLDVQSSGNLAVETGRAMIGLQPPGQPMTTQAGKYVVVWQRGADGQWRLLRDIWNSGGPGK
jgi:uncharacterized protein (TIGR02246 family)